MQKFFQFLAFVIVLGLLASLGVMLRYPGEYPMRTGREFDARVRTYHRDNLEKQKPQVVFMGDSTLRESVDFDQLSELLGMQTYGVAVPGSTTALWYLVLKNNILPAAHKPETLVIFTRETLLTTPDYRVDGHYFPTIDEYAYRDEPLLQEFSYLGQMSFLERLAVRYVPLYGKRAEVRASIDYRIDHMLPLLFDCGEVCVDGARRTVFSGDVYVEAFMQEQDMVDSYLWGMDKLFFRRQLERSYLPEIVRMTKENGIQLILVEVKTWSRPDSTTTALLRAAYLRDLQAYADRNSIPIISFADDPRLPRTYFPDGFHLAPEAIPYFTNLLAEELTPLVTRP